MNATRNLLDDELQAAKVENGLKTVELIGDLESRFNAKLDQVKSDFNIQLEKKDQRIDQIKGQIVQKDQKIEV